MIYGETASVMIELLILILTIHLAMFCKGNLPQLFFLHHKIVGYSC